MVPAEAMQIGLRALRAGRPDQTVTAMDRLLAANPLDAQATHLRAIARIELGEPQAATVELRRSLVLTPTNGPASIHLGIEESKQGFGGDAKRHYHRALAIQPGDPYALFSLANLLTRAGHHRRASTAYQQALRTSPMDADIFLGLISALNNIREGSRVVSVARRAIIANPSDSRVLLELAKLAERENLTESASILAQYALSVPPSQVETRCRIARFLASHGADRTALARLRETTAAVPQDGRPWREISAIQFNLRQFDQAHHSLLHSLAADPSYDRPLEIILQTMLTLGRREEADRLTGEILRSRPLSSRTRERIDTIFAGSRPDSTEQEIDADRSVLLTRFAQSFYRQGQPTLSQALLKRVLKLGDAPVEASAALLRQFTHAGDLANARITADALPAKLRDHPRIVDQLATLDLALLHDEVDRLHRDGTDVRRTPPELTVNLNSPAGRILTSIRDAIAAAPLKRAPFHHVFARGVFPEDLYPEIVRRLPRHDELDWGKNPGYPDRAVLPLTWSGSDPLWRTIQEVCDHPDMLNLAVHAIGGERLRDALRGHGYELTGSSALTIDRRGYALGPHQDHVARFGSALLYLPAPGGRETLGTSVYRPKFETPRHDNGKHLEFDEFDRVDTVPFEANSGFFFLNFGDAYHGVEPVHEESLRELLQYTIYIRRSEPPAINAS